MPYSFSEKPPEEPIEPPNEPVDRVFQDWVVQSIRANEQAIGVPMNMWII